MTIIVEHHGTQHSIDVTASVYERFDNPSYLNYFSFKTDTNMNILASKSFFRSQKNYK